jgi:hypothetical protein
VELLYLLIEWLTAIVFEAFIDTFMYMGLTTLVVGILLSILYLRFYD